MEEDEPLDHDKIWRSGFCNRLQVSNELGNMIHGWHVISRSLLCAMVNPCFSQPFVSAKPCAYLRTEFLKSQEKAKQNFAGVRSAKTRGEGCSCIEGRLKSLTLPFAAALVLHCDRQPMCSRM